MREYFPYITETDLGTFTDCVRCLIAFTTSKFNSDVSLNAIAFLRFCAVKLAEGGLVSNVKTRVIQSPFPETNGSAPGVHTFSPETTENPLDVQKSNSGMTKNTSDETTVADMDDNALYWLPLLKGNLYSSWAPLKAAAMG